MFWFAVIAALAFLPTLISVLSGPVQAGGAFLWRPHLYDNKHLGFDEASLLSASRLHGEPGQGT